MKTIIKAKSGKSELYIELDHKEVSNALSCVYKWHSGSDNATFLNSIKAICDNVARMERGEVVELEDGHDGKP